MERFTLLGVLMHLDTVNELLESIEELKKGQVKDLVYRRLKEFSTNGKKSNRGIFKELCFCILCANYNAERSIKIQVSIGDGFLTLTESQLAEKLKALGYRFPNSRAKYILEARKFKDSLKQIIASFDDESKLREWLIKYIKGIGLKEASHFLRNIGYINFAILDFHIIELLVRSRLIEKPRTLTKRKYLEIEELLRGIAGESKLNMAELDLYLWYMETGKVLK